MRFMKKGLALALSLALVVTLCPANTEGAKKPKISKKKATVVVGKTITLKVKNGVKKAKVSWKSSKKTVAKVTRKVTAGKKASAKILGVAKGKATITATYVLGKSKKKLTCKLTVTGGTVTPSVTTGPNAPTTPVVTSAAVVTTAPSDVPIDTPVVKATKTPKPTGTPKPTATPTPTPRYTPPSVTALPNAPLSLVAANYVNEKDGAEIVENADGSITITFRTQYDAVNFYLPDNAQTYYSGYKYVTIDYVSTGADLGHALYDADCNWGENAGEGETGKHPNWNKQIKAAPSGNRITFEVTSECVGNCIRGLQVFNPNETGTVTTITINAIVFSTTSNVVVPTKKPGSATASPVPSGTTYTQVASLSEIKDGDKIIMIYNGAEASDKNPLYMLPQSKSASGSTGTRIGLATESLGSTTLGSALTGNVGAKAFTFTKSGSGWLIGDGTKYVKLTETSDTGITATLESTGSVFTIGGSQNAFTFTSGSTALNYNSRGIINGYASKPASFYLYRLATTATPTTAPSATDAPSATAQPLPSAYKADLSAATALYGTGTVTYDAETGSVKGEGLNGLLIPIGASILTGSTLKVTLHGSSSAGMRMWLSDGEDTASNIINPATMDSTATLTVSAASANNIQIKGSSYNTIFNELIVTSVDVEVVANATPSPVPTPRPTRDPATIPTLAPGMPELDENNLTVASYPTIPSDIPDLDIIRVGQNYYMVSTTMNLVPGVPVMKSTDLVHWEIVNYACNRFPNKDLFNLTNGKQTYHNGSWAASLKYNEETGLFYVIYNVNSDGFYCYTTDDIENGEWKAYYTTSGFHDPALIFDGDGMYVIYNGNNIQKLRLEEATTPGGIGKVVSEGSSRALFSKNLGGYNWSLWEGAHAYKIGDYYYLMIIGSYGSWFRREICYRSTKLYDSVASDWEAQMVFEGSTYEYGTGIAQGGIVDTIYGDWYGFLFQDHDGLGRVPSILAVDWDYTDSNGKNYADWPMMGYYDNNDVFVSCQGTSQKVTKPLTIRLNDSGKESYYVGDDDFSYPDYKPGDNLKKVWQWNHNPDDSSWSVTENPGYYRIKNNVLANNIWFARNSLTQRTVSNTFKSETCILTDHMKPGDYAGIGAISSHYAMIGVKCDANGDRYIFQGNNSNNNSGAKAVATDVIKENAIGPKIEGNDPVYLKIEYTFKSANSGSDRANFFYSLDGTNWTKLGNQFSMGFDTGTTFMGTRTWLVSYATQQTGGYVDFDYYKQYK